MQSVAAAVSGAVSFVTGSSATSTHDGSAAFLRRANALEFSAAAALQVLGEFNGDEEAAVRSMADAFCAAACPELDRGTAFSNGPPEVDTGDANESDLAESDPKPRRLPPHFNSNDAREAVLDVFLSFVAPMLPKPQTDGSFKNGDPELLDTLMVTPLVLALPRAERLAHLINPVSGWDDASLKRARSFFLLAAAGVQFVIYALTQVGGKGDMVLCTASEAVCGRSWHLDGRMCVL